MHRTGVRVPASGTYAVYGRGVRTSTVHACRQCMHAGSACLRASIRRSLTQY
jgi:hypothetical protein